MFVGSFNGIYVTELTDDGLSVKRNENGTPTLKKQVCGKAFEGTNIYKKNGYYYLFASINNCCDGERSRYKVVVGRSQDLLGPYLDKSGKDMINNAWSWYWKEMARNSLVLVITHYCTRRCRY